EKLVKGEVSPERVWLSGVADVSDLQEGTLTPQHARTLAEVAKRLEDGFGSPQDAEWVIHRDTLHIVQSRPIPAAFSKEAPTDATPEITVTPVLTGVPASSGTGSGAVHLVFNIEQALRLQSGRVLVTPMTNPDMVVAMRNSAAIVTDVGGMICHAAIVSRELGLPCVVGTETATVTLGEGDPVTVDGSRGAVDAGILDIARPAESARPSEWADIWSIWAEATAGRADLLPIVATAEALEAMPPGIDAAVLVPDLDLRADGQGLWNDLQGMAPE